MNNNQRDFLVRQEQRAKQRRQDAGKMGNAAYKRGKAVAAPLRLDMTLDDAADIPSAMLWWGDEQPDWSLDNLDGDWGMWDEMKKRKAKSDTPWGALLIAWRNR